MNFERFAEMHGLIIQSLTFDKWTRVPTISHPHKKNGAYIYDGKTGAVQNWAVHEKPVSWKGDAKPDPMWHQKRRSLMRLSRNDRSRLVRKRDGY